MYKLQRIDKIEFLDFLRASSANPEASSFNCPLHSLEFLEPLLDVFGHSGIEYFSYKTQSRPSAVIPVFRNGRFTASAFAPSQLPITPLISVCKNLDVIDFASKVIRKFPYCLAFSMYHYDNQVLPIVRYSNQHLVSTYATTISIEDTQSFDKYLQSRPKKLRENLKRYEKRTDKDGIDVLLNVVTAKSGMREALRRYSDIEAQGWKGNAGTAIEYGDQQWGFYLEMLSRHAENSDAYVFELLFDDEIVASRIGITTNRTLVFLKTTFDEKYKRYAAGRLLLSRAIEYILENDISKSIEFYTNANSDMLQWSTDRRKIVHVTTYRDSAVRKVAEIRAKFKSR